MVHSGDGGSWAVARRRDASGRRRTSQAALCDVNGGRPVSWRARSSDVASRRAVRAHAGTRGAAGGRLGALARVRGAGERAEQSGRERGEVARPGAPCRVPRSCLRERAWAGRGRCARPGQARWRRAACAGAGQAWWRAGASRAGRRAGREGSALGARGRGREKEGGKKEEKKNRKRERERKEIGRERDSRRDRGARSATRGARARVSATRGSRGK